MTADLRIQLSAIDISKELPTANSSKLRKDDIFYLPFDIEVFFLAICPVLSFCLSFSFSYLFYILSVDIIGYNFVVPRVKNVGIREINSS